MGTNGFNPIFEISAFGTILHYAFDEGNDYAVEEANRFAEWLEGCGAKRIGSIVVPQGGRKIRVYSFQNPVNLTQHIVADEGVSALHHIECGNQFCTAYLESNQVDVVQALLNAGWSFDEKYDWLCPNCAEGIEPAEFDYSGWQADIDNAWEDYDLSDWDWE